MSVSVSVCLRCVCVPFHPCGVPQWESGLVLGGSDAGGKDKDSSFKPDWEN